MHENFKADPLKFPKQHFMLQHCVPPLAAAPTEEDFFLLTFLQFLPTTRFPGENSGIPLVSPNCRAQAAKSQNHTVGKEENC